MTSAGRNVAPIWSRLLAPHPPPAARAFAQRGAALDSRHAARGSSMGLRKSLRYFSLICFMLVLVPEHWPGRAAEENAEQLPRLGETTAEFEARMKGLARPPSSDSVTLIADSLGHFFVQPIVNGTRLRMMVDTG